MKSRILVSIPIPQKVQTFVWVCVGEWYRGVAEGHHVAWIKVKSLK